MKSTNLLLLIIAVVACACRHHAANSFSINGHIQGLKSPFIYLAWQDNNSEHLDSSAVKKGKFSFSGTVEEPTMAFFYLTGYKSYVEFFLENADIQVTGKTGSLQEARITGSRSQDDYAAYRTSVQPLSERLKKLKRDAENTTADKAAEAIAMADRRADSLQKTKNEITKAFIRFHPESFVSLQCLQTLSYETDNAAGIEHLFSMLDTSIQHSVSGKKLAAHIEHLKNIPLGEPALPFTLNDIHGKPVNLSDFLGSYVLIDFWASWCRPCRVENRGVIQAYNQYQDKGFTVLSISLDNDVSEWKKAVKDDHLVWTQVRDRKGAHKVARLYGVDVIPFNFLVDPNGIIIARNLRGRDLKKKLAEVLK